MAAAAIRRLDPDALVDSMGTANLAYGETTDVGEPRLDPYLAFSVPAHRQRSPVAKISSNMRRP